jgi:glycine oxidase
MTGLDVVVVGGGVIGLSAAWRLAQAGARVQVFYGADQTGAASTAAAGMLTPVTEAYWGEEALLALTLDSMRRWPAFAAELGDQSGIDVAFEQRGVLAVGLDGDDLAEIDDLHRLHEQFGLPTKVLRGRDLRAVEPMLAPQVRRGFLAPDDGAVDPRRVWAALTAAVNRAGGTLHPWDVDALVLDGNRVTGVEIDGEVRSAGAVLLAAGAWSPLVTGLPVAAVPQVRPVYGEVLRLRAGDGGVGGRPSSVLRAVVRGRHVYVVPRDSGEVVVGATSRERGYDTRVTAGGAYELLRDARSVLPGLDELELVEATAGLRPGTPDNAPMIGWSGVEGLFLATGHYRNGILLTPVTADAVASVLTGGELPDVVARAAAPDRFGSRS